jgi:cystathionine gamma-synthase
LVADNTFLSPGWQTPIAHGADIVLHSTTKYLNGHSDVVGGAVVARTPELHEELDWWANCLGLTGAPFDSFLTLRGVRTLHARCARTRRTRRRWWSCWPRTRRWSASTTRASRPPGARDRAPPAARLRRHDQLRAGRRRAGGEAFLDGLEHFFLAESLGGVESLVAHPATMTHAAMDPEARRRAGLGDSLLRLSVGIEAAEDLVADLAAGLERAGH